jgi:hypothetical protein
MFLGKWDIRTLTIANLQDGAEHWTFAALGCSRRIRTFKVLESSQSTLNVPAKAEH